ncbi:unnamed protein product [Symbiodinium natans]|uniref:Uncharacterized protein n=1 Tax=Symbiodinium natans TaxID=878477 RepID=A0A812I276_9DINO|nr:unnamed protein product [Symbiodinium natans]
MVKDEEDEVLHRVHEKRQQTLKATATLWSLAVEIFMSGLFLAQLCCQSAGIPQFWPLLIATIWATVILRNLSTSTEIAPARLNRDMTVLTVLVFGASLGVPRELLPLISMARVMVSSFFTDAALSNKANLVLTPFYIVSYWLQGPEDSSVGGLLIISCGELLVVSYLALAVSNLDVKEYQLAAATLELERKVHETQEAERTGGAAQRLLTVMCDAFVRLTPDLKIFQPSRSVSDLLMCGFSSAMAATTLDGVPLIRYINPPDHQRFTDFIKESSQAGSPARSLQVSMKDSGGVVFNVELFHVSVPGLRTGTEHEHLLGITQNSQKDSFPTERTARLERGLERAAAAGADCTRSHSASSHAVSHGANPSDAVPELLDMRHILGYKLESQGSPDRQHPGSNSRESRGSRSSRSSRSDHLVPLRSLEKVNIGIDVHTLDEGFRLQSMLMTFASDPEHGPNLMDWIQPHYRDMVYNHIQDHANACYAGRDCKQPSLRGIKFHSPIASARSVLVGKLGVGCILDTDKGHPESGSDDGSGTSCAMHIELELTQLFAH